MATATRALPPFSSSPWGELTGLYSTAERDGAMGIRPCGRISGKKVEGLPSPDLLQEYGLGRCVDDGHRFAGSLARFHRHGLDAASPSAVGHFGLVRSSMIYVDVVGRAA